MRLYLEGGNPRPAALAKIAAANHVSLDWLAAARGPPEHEDFILADYQGDVAVAQRSSVMEPMHEAGNTLTRIAADLQMEIPMRWFAVLSVQLAGRQMSATAARAILEALKADLKGGST